MQKRSSMLADSVGRIAKHSLCVLGKIIQMHQSEVCRADRICSRLGQNSTKRGILSFIFAVFLLTITITITDGMEVYSLEADSEERTANVRNRAQFHRPHYSLVKVDASARRPCFGQII